MIKDMDPSNYRVAMTSRPLRFMMAWNSGRSASAGVALTSFCMPAGAKQAALAFDGQCTIGGRSASAGAALTSLCMPAGAVHVGIGIDLLLIVS